jgi:hypothetical protein
MTLWLDAVSSWTIGDARVSADADLPAKVGHTVVPRVKWNTSSLAVPNRMLLVRLGSW